MGGIDGPEPRPAPARPPPATPAVGADRVSVRDAAAWLASDRGLRTAAVFVAVAAAAVLVLHAVLVFHAFFFDDAWISLRYANRLIQGAGLTWNDGERVEGYSNFLWVVLVAAAGFVTRADLVPVARAIGLACASAGLFAIVRGNAPRRRAHLLPLLAVTVGLAGSGPVAAWATGGLEQPLLSALLVWGFVLAYPLLGSERPGWRAVALPGLLWGLAAITRPDGIVIPAVACAGVWMSDGFRRRDLDVAARLGVIPVAILALHLLGRHAYYGTWVPNTYHAKVAFTWPRFHAGLAYVLGRPSPRVFAAALPLVFVAALHDVQRRRRLLFVLPPVLTWCGYVAAIGGDIMPERRHMVPVFYLLALLAADGASWLAEQRAPAARIGAQLGAIGLLCAVAALERGDPDRFAATRQTWAWYGKPLGNLLGAAFGDRQPLLAVDAAGATPYYSGLPTVDMLGLNDAFLAHHPPRDLGHAAMGHELGDGKYVLERAPDIVMFHLPPGTEAPRWRSGTEMVRSPEWKRRYRLVRFETPEPERLRALLWIRAEGGRIGIRRDAGAVMIPGFLFASPRGGVATLAGGNAIATVLDAGETTLLSLRLDPGRWTVHVDASAALALRVAGVTPPVDTDASTAALDVPSTPDLVVRIELTARDERATLRAVTFARAQ